MNRNLSINLYRQLIAKMAHPKTLQHLRMQITSPRELLQGNSIFDVILQEFSSKHIEIEQQSAPVDSASNCIESEIDRNKNIENGNEWAWSDEVPQKIKFQEDQFLLKEQTYLEIKRVKSLREEQEGKIAQFLKSERNLQIRHPEEQKQVESPIKTSFSLSPRKTKKIDKMKPLKLILKND